MYIDAYHNQKNGKISVVERVNGQRVFKEYLADYTFYYSHPSGSHLSIYGDQCKKFTTNNNKKFRSKLREIEQETKRDGSPKHIIFESDINPVFRCLSTVYKNCQTPEPCIGFFDIETGFCDDRGYAPASDPFNPVTAVSIYISNINRCITLVLKPDDMDYDEAQKISSSFEDTVLFDDESELLKTFLDIADDVDIFSGWNSTLFDIPYIVNRIKRICGEVHLKKLCHWGKFPMKRMIPRYGKEHESYELFGRVHLDYLELYQKHNPKQMASYRLDFIGEVEVGEKKVTYEGTLNDLYTKDFNKFIEYSRQDVMLLVQIDEKKQFISLANQIAHVNSVLYKTTMGSVTLVEQAIINEMHEMGMVVPCRKADDKEEIDFNDMSEEEKAEADAPVVGAYVAIPKTGIHEHIGCVDINSLYPSAIRALNISPETIVGQLLPILTDAEIKRRMSVKGAKRSESWDGLFASLEFEAVITKDTNTNVTLKFDSGEEKTLTGEQMYNYIYNPKNQLCITANGTVFTTKQEGIIPQLLAKWYSQRQQMQSMEKLFKSIHNHELELDKDLAEEVMALMSS